MNLQKIVLFLVVFCIFIGTTFSATPMTINVEVIQGQIGTLTYNLILFCSVCVIFLILIQLRNKKILVTLIILFIGISNYLTFFPINKTYYGLMDISYDRETKIGTRYDFEGVNLFVNGKITNKGKILLGNILIILILGVLLYKNSNRKKL